MHRTPTAFGLVLAAALVVGSATPSLARVNWPRHVDPKSWEVPEDMTWKDYKPVPNVPYYDKDYEPTVKSFRAALILGDFPDYKFRVEATNQDVTGQRGLGVEDPAAYWVRYLFRNESPKAPQRGHTVDEYWKENSYGQIGVEAQAFGPYTMDDKYYEYGIGDFGTPEDCPDGPDGCKAGEDPTGLLAPFDVELFDKSTADVEIAQAEHGEFDFRFLLHAGYDESGTWLNYGQAIFPKPEAVTEKFGPPGHPGHRNWATTRYVPWSSFWSSQHIWSHALPGLSSTQGESDGGSTYAHELSHIFGILDNYNNPYAENPRRAYSGPWDMMSRGTFNGPGGPFERWSIPPTEGGTMGSHHMIRNKLRLGFLPASEVLTVQRSALEAAGLIKARVLQRESPPALDSPNLHSGVRIVLGEDAHQCSTAEPKCDGGNYDQYDIEVVNRQGFDSFIPDHGVIISKSKNADASPFIWVIDAHPKNLKRVDYVAADGTKSYYTVGDYRQLSDAAFHAGTAPGTKNIYVDKANNLAFHVLGTKTLDRRRVYTVVVRSLTAPDVPSPATVEKTKGEELRRDRVTGVVFKITNTGQADALYKLSLEKSGVKTRLLNDLKYIKAGDSKKIVVYAQKRAADVSLTLKAKEL